VRTRYKQADKTYDDATTRIHSYVEAFENPSDDALKDDPPQDEMDSGSLDLV